MPPTTSPRPTTPSRPPEQPLPADKAAAAFRVPPGFHVTVFAAEPDVRNPIAMAWDTRGRLWIAENYTYAERTKKFDLGLRDRVLIFEDRDGDGRFDRRTVFTDEPQRLTSVELGLGGVWLLCPPQLLFVPDRDGDDVPDGPAEVVLDGFTVPPENYHTFANGLRWGPDGWLYGRCGASSLGPDRRPRHARRRARPALRRPLAVPPRRQDVRGARPRHDQPLGPRLERPRRGVLHQHGQRPPLACRRRARTSSGGHTIDPNPRVYALIDQHADHWHWDNAKDWTDSRSASGEHDRRGGGHAHSGAMIYLGDQWPAAYRDKLFTLNLHGRRVNVERLERSGSGYVGRHEPDMLFAGDPWFRGIDLGYGPDGSVFVLDWSDTGECHESNGVHRTSGRIYKITYGTPPQPAPAGSTWRGSTNARWSNCTSTRTSGTSARPAASWPTRAARGDRLDAARAALLDRVDATGRPGARAPRPLGAATPSARPIADCCSAWPATSTRPSAPGRSAC